MNLTFWDKQEFLCLLFARQMSWALVVMVMATITTPPAWAQNAELSGVVRDAQAGVVVGATLRLTDTATGISLSTLTNASGVYLFSSVKPSMYRLEVSAPGFSPLTETGIILNVEQRAAVDLVLVVEGRAEEVTVTAGVILGRSDGSVGTVIDRRFAEDLPALGRSFSALVRLAPGVAGTASASSTAGSGFSINGQRSISNSLTVDGVSGLSETDGAGLINGAGQRLASSVTGTINGGVSMDALQEFRVQTSSFAPEFGRTPGGQISLVTRSGGNAFHGSVFEQFRNENLMANDWFANSRGLSKAPLDEHQFGGAIGGPILKGRTFFFGSFEGIRLSQPVSVNNTVPSLEARARDSSGVLTALYPEPTGPSRADLTAEYLTNRHRSRATTDTWGLRLDHSLRSGIQLFGRFAAIPSTVETDNPFATQVELNKEAQSITAGLTARAGAKMLFEVRAVHGYSDYAIRGRTDVDVYRWLPESLSEADTFSLAVTGLTGIRVGSAVHYRTPQSSAIGTVSYVEGNHHFKAGVDYRQLKSRDFPRRTVTASFANLSEVFAWTVVPAVTVIRWLGTEARYNNVSVYVQDNWKIRSRLSATYGVRWDINPAPAFGKGDGPLAVQTFTPISQLSIVTTPNVSLWKTRYRNVYPRLGVSYAFDQNATTVLSAGAGLFGDLDGAAAGNNSWGLTTLSRTNVALPLTNEDVRGVETELQTPPYRTLIFAVDPNLESARTIHWNVTLERVLGSNQSVWVAYVGADGRHVLQSQQYPPGISPAFLAGFLTISGSGRTAYQSLQLQYRRRAPSGVHLTASYTLGNAKETSPSIVSLDKSSILAPSSNDVRHLFNTGVSWNLPGPSSASWFGAIVRDWSFHALGTARSGYPFSVRAAALLIPGEEQFQRRASFVPGVPVVIDDHVAPGGQRHNRAAFSNPPTGQQGDTGRNEFRGLSAYQIDLGLQRTVRIIASSKIKIRIDAFNVLNHPQFGLPDSELSSATFGIPTVSAASASSANLASSLYQIGGPRSVAVSARFEF